MASSLFFQLQCEHSELKRSFIDSICRLILISNMMKHHGSAYLLLMPPMLRRKVMPAAYLDTALIAAVGSAVAGAMYYVARKE